MIITFRKFLICNGVSFAGCWAADSSCSPPTPYLIGQWSLATTVLGAAAVEVLGVGGGGSVRPGGPRQ